MELMILIEYKRCKAVIHWLKNWLGSGPGTGTQHGKNGKVRRGMACLAVLLAVVVPVGRVAGLDQEIRLAGDGNKPWQDIRSLEGLRLEKGKWGQADVLLQDREYAVTAETDLLLHFNTNPPREETGHYGVAPAVVVLSEQNKMRGAAAYAFQSRQTALRLTPGAGSLFKKGWQDFSLEFWLYPSNLSDFETVFDWSGQVLLANTTQSQYVRCQIKGRKLSWEFYNFFVGEKSARFAVTGLNHLLPRTWAHHLLRFDSGLGLVEYLVNGEVEGILYVTETGEEGGAICRPKTDNKGSLVLGADYTGLLDEMRLVASFVERPGLQRYQGQTGICQSRIFDLAYTGTRIKTVNAIFSAPDNSALYFYFRLSDRLESFSLPDYEWQPFLPNAPFSPLVTGRYLQLKAEFLPDGTYSRSPVLSEIRVLYEPDLPPTPPAYLIAKAGQGQVTLTWQKLNEADVKGYEIFYGNEPGQYFGTDCAQGASPLVVEDPVADNKTISYTLTNLTNGKLYYFNVVAFDQARPPHKSGFSKEVSARPSRLAGGP